jgi:hypothetical protein
MLIIAIHHDVIVAMMQLFLDVLYGVFQILEVLGEIVDEILHVVQLVLSVVVVLSQLADFSHHVVDAVVEASLILLETIDESLSAACWYTTMPTFKLTATTASSDSLIVSRRIREASTTASTT